MAKTQAERAKEYRQRKRDGGATMDDLCRDANKVACDAVTAKRDENVTEPERDASVPNVTKEALLEAVIGPPQEPMDALKLYSQTRWAILQGKGYVMPPETECYDGQLTLDGGLPFGFHNGYARKVLGPVYQWAVPVPGDPAYKGVA